MATPHNSAEPGAFAKTVLMPGDPLRAKFIAETFLKEPKLVNNVRGIQGYTGTYKDTPVSVMASGMGCPSIGIYSYELFTQYGVDNILRIGSAGAISADLKLRDVVAGMGACTNSCFANQYRLPGNFAPIASYDLLSLAVESAAELGVRMPVGNLFSSDTFYDAASSTMEWAKMGCLAVEMEAAALYCNAAFTHKRALAICSISDSLVTGEELNAEERQNTFTSMMKIALEVAVKATKLPECVLADHGASK
ncbi:MAG: purine-nucleoside phosphorylase [Ruminococcaceae bacterium]|jgi:purine-nucleoside phosphorylase|nr:purine-nucleoside phosphorylase [Oscillospiraceae bacterium]